MSMNTSDNMYTIAQNREMEEWLDKAQEAADLTDNQRAHLRTRALEYSASSALTPVGAIFAIGHNAGLWDDYGELLPWTDQAP